MKKVKHTVLIIALLISGVIGMRVSLNAQERRPEFHRTINTNRISFTTKAYHDEAFKLVLQEVNRVAKGMKLEDDLPLTTNNIVRAFISPYGYARREHGIGNITTSKYCYYLSVGDKFSYIEGTHQTEACFSYSKQYAWPTNKIDFDEARKQASEWLAAASMDVPALDRDCKCAVQVDPFYGHYGQIGRGEFVPVYFVSWTNSSHPPVGEVASVRVFTPTKALLQLRVEDPNYILRKPLVFTNLAELLRQTNALSGTPSPGTP